MPEIHPIAYQIDSSVLFEAIRNLPYCCWLDSGRPRCKEGRYDILTACPAERYVTRGKSTSIYHCNFVDRSDYLVTECEEDPFTLVESAVNRLVCKDDRLPFIGGAVGYLGYDLARHLIALPSLAESKCRLADMHVGIYHWAIIQDHHKQKSFIVSLPTCEPSLLREIMQRLSSISRDLPCQKSHQKTERSFKLSRLHSNMTAESYLNIIQKIDAYIRAGDCYQINLAQCFDATYQGDPYWVYQQLRQPMASPFSAYLSMGDQHLLCLSPERFIKITDGQVLTQPIKGTVSRHEDPLIDHQLAKALQNSPKNRAENVMIVDLLRNDLGKTCIPGSIQVDKLFALESFPNVHHLVSSITGTIDHMYSAMDTLKACFPGGSITGAPKKRAMEIIEELEPYRRSVYCGSISYISANCCLDSNIIIRSVICDSQRLYCWGGGGIVADSHADDEYQESLTKIQRILDILNTFV
jgi:para-aminobenzoate synthetase component I